MTQINLGGDSAGKPPGADVSCRALADLLDDGFAAIEVLFDADDTGVDYRFVDVNRAFEQQSGLADLVGRTAREVFPSIEPFWIDTFARVARSGEPARFERQDPGSGKWFSVKAARLSGSPARVLGLIFCDITAERHEAVLRRDSEERLRIALDAADLGIWDVDLRTGSALMRSPRHDEIFGFSEPQPEWTVDIALTHIVEEHRQHVVDAVALAVETGTLSSEFCVRWPDGTLHWAECTGRTYYDEQGAPVRMAGVIADITARKTAEHALRDSETLFRTMADTIPVIVWTTDHEGRVEFFNREWSSYTGAPFPPTTAAEVADQHLHPDDVALAIQRFDESRASGEPFTTEHRIRAASGEYRWFQVQAEAYRDPGTGQIQRWFGTSIDIHERRQAAQSLHETAQSQAFQLQLSDAIRNANTSDEIIDVTSAMLGEHLQALRVSYFEVTGPDSLSVVRDWAADARDSLTGTTVTMSKFGASHIDELRAGRLVVNHDVESDPRTAAHAGEFIARGVRSELAVPIVRAGQLKMVVAIHKAQPHQWKDSEVQLAQAVSQQILLAAEAATAENELRAERDLSRAIFNSMEEGFALLGADWTFIDVNEIGARTSQLAREEIIGRNHWEVLPETIGTSLESLYRRVMATGVHETLEFLHEPPGRETRWVEVRPYRLAGIGMVVFFRDICERKRIEQVLNDSVRRRDEFLAMLAHELRNPLAPIRAAAHILGMPEIDKARVTKTSEVITRQVEHMTSLVDDLLDVSRVTRGQITLETAALDVKRVVSDAVEQARPLIEARRHHLNVQLAPERAHVSGDHKRLVQVLTNLLNNAAKFTPEGGHIAVKMEVEDEHVSLTVVDDGIGMSADMTENAFGLFAQAERTADRTQGGLGIGLALVKSLVELHGGTVCARSPGTGLGSKFTVCLPRLNGSTLGIHSGTAGRPDRKGQSLRILIVDDNEDAASMLAMFLEASGHRAMIEHGPRQGLRRALAERPDVCLLDIGLPDMDGNELARQLRSHPETEDALLIAVTGYGQDLDRENTTAAGFDHHLVKPLHPSTLAGILAAARLH